MIRKNTPVGFLCQFEQTDFTVQYEGPGDTDETFKGILISGSNRYGYALGHRKNWSRAQFSLYSNLMKKEPK